MRGKFSVGRAGNGRAALFLLWACAVCLTAGCGSAPCSLHEALQQAWEESRAPGALVAVRAADGAWTEFAFGRQSVAPDAAAMTPNLRFPLASVSKLFAGYLLLDLVDDGKLGLDDRIGEYFPEWATETWNPTIRQVAAHRSGLFNPVSDRAFQDRVMRSPERIWTDRELLTFALERTGSDKQGEFHYSNASTSLLVLIMEKVTRQSYEDLLEDRLFKPFVMREARVLSDPGLPEPHARGYRYGEPERPIGYGAELMDLTHWSPAWAGAGGNLAGTLADLQQAVAPLLFGEGLSERSRQTRRRFRSTYWYFWHWDYGLHFSEYDNAYIGHLGDIPGWSVAMLREKNGHRVAIVLTNLSNTQSGDCPARILAEAALAWK